MFNRVAEFHRTFNQLVTTSPELPDQSVRDLRDRLLLEELNEFEVADRTNDMVERADALADMCYIISGTCVSYGICPEGQRYESPYDNSSWIHRQLKIFYNLQLDRIVREDYENYVKAEGTNDLVVIKDSLIMMMMDIFGIGLHLGIPLNAVFAEVHRSNMSKADENGRPIFREDGKVLKSKRYSPPDIKRVLLEHGFVEAKTGLVYLP